MLLEKFHLLDPGIQFPDICPEHRGDPFGFLLQNTHLVQIGIVQGLYPF